MGKETMKTPMNSLVGLMRVKTPAHNMYGFLVHTALPTPLPVV